MGLLCGIDVGTTGLKLGLFRPDGEAVGVAPVEYAFTSPQEGFAEMAGEVYWDALKAALQDCCRQGDCRPSEVDAIGVSTTGQAFLLIDKDGRELTPMIVWLDRRGDEFVPAVRELVDDFSYFAVTGIPRISGMSTLPKLMWYRRHQPEVLARADCVLLIDSYVIWRLTGERVASTNIAGFTGMWRTDDECWWLEMLELAGIEAERLPALRKPAEVGGTVSAQAAAATGLREGVQVAVGTNDQIAGTLGAGNVEPGIFTDSTGTAMAVLTTVAELPEPDPHGHSPLWTRHAVPGMYELYSFCNTSGILLKWLRESVGFCESYEELAALAATSVPGCNGIAICPHYEGTLFPEPLPDATGIIAGLRLRHGRADLVRAFFEAVAYSLRENVEFLARGRSAERIRSLGGAAKSAFWLQMKADVTGCPVERPLCQEAAILGDALMAGKAIGLYDSLADAARRVVRVEPFSWLLPCWSVWEHGPPITRCQATLSRSCNASENIWRTFLRDCISSCRWALIRRSSSPSNGN